MSLRLDGKNFLVTGGASGIGRAAALRFAEEGANVCIADRQAKAAEETAAEVRKHGRKSVAVEADVSNPAQVQAMVDRAAKDLGGIDIVLAAAGVSAANYGESKVEPKFLNELSFDEWRKVLAYQSRRRVPYLPGGCARDDQTESRRPYHRDFIGRGQGSPQGSGEYCVSKAGVWMLMKCMALELGRYNITANAIGPGVIDTPMTKDMQSSRRFERMVNGIPVKRIGKPVDVANTALSGQRGRRLFQRLDTPSGRRHNHAMRRCTGDLPDSSSAL